MEAVRESVMFQNSRELYDNYNRLPGKEKREFVLLLIKSILSDYFGREANEYDIEEFLLSIKKVAENSSSNHEIIDNSFKIYEALDKIDNQIGEADKCKEAVGRAIRLCNTINNNVDAICALNSMIDRLDEV